MGDYSFNFIERFLFAKCLLKFYLLRRKCSDGVVINVTVWNTYSYSSLLILRMKLPIYDFEVMSYLQWLILFYLLVVSLSTSPRKPDLSSRFVHRTTFRYCT